MNKRAEIAEAKLAQIEKQEPVGAAYSYYTDGIRCIHASVNMSFDVPDGTVVALYASPVSDSLRVEAAKLAKYCEWYESVDELGAFPDIQDVMVPLGDLRALRAALKGDSNDKG